MIEILLIMFATYLICLALVLSIKEAQANKPRFEKFIQEEVKKLNDYKIHHGFQPIFITKIPKYSLGKESE